MSSQAARLAEPGIHDPCQVMLPWHLSALGHASAGRVLPITERRELDEELREVESSAFWRVFIVRETREAQIVVHRLVGHMYLVVSEEIFAFGYRTDSLYTLPHKCVCTIIRMFLKLNISTSPYW